MVHRYPDARFMKWKASPNIRKMVSQISASTPSSATLSTLSVIDGSVLWVVKVASSSTDSIKDLTSSPVAIRFAVCSAVGGTQPSLFRSASSSKAQGPGHLLRLPFLPPPGLGPIFSALHRPHQSPTPDHHHLVNGPVLRSFPVGMAHPRHANIQIHLEKWPRDWP